MPFLYVLLMIQPFYLCNYNSKFNGWMKIYLQAVSSLFAMFEAVLVLSDSYRILLCVSIDTYIKKVSKEFSWNKVTILQRPCFKSLNHVPSHVS